jgi:hypothetical protein
LRWHTVCSAERANKHCQVGASERKFQVGTQQPFDRLDDAINASDKIVDSYLQRINCTDALFSPFDTTDDLYRPAWQLLEGRQLPAANQLYGCPL